MQDVWELKNRNKEVTIDGNGSRDIKVAVYCRVSTSHEEQLNALDNQIKWCDEFLKDHPHLKLVNDCFFSASKRAKFDCPINKKGFYIDAGRSGVDIKHRPAFQKMIDDAKAGKFDLIIVRDTSRFSRNLRDYIEIIRDLKNLKNSVGIYFASNGLFSLNKANETMLNMLAIIAEKESQTTSERILNNINITRSKGILYGNGNILGYDLLITEDGSNQYVINNEQANVVKEIFRMCYEGLGISKIGNELTRKQYKNSSGKIKWGYHNIQRILHNKTYCGYLSYNKNYTVDCLTKQRKNSHSSEAIYKKAPPDIVPEIINEELFDACQKKLLKRKERFEPKTAAKESSAKNIFARKMRCSCGNSFRRDFWHTNKKGITTYGYTCYNVLNYRKKDFYHENNIPTDGLNLCNMPAISETKMKMQAIKVFNNVFESETLIEKTISKIKKQQSLTNRDYDKEIEIKKLAIEKIKKRQDKYVDKLVDEVISEDQYNRSMERTNKEIDRFNEEIHRLTKEKASIKSPVIDSEKIAKALSEILDCTNDINEKIIEKYVYRIIVKGPNDFVWQLHFKPILSDEPVFIELNKCCVSLDDAIEYSKLHSTHIKRSNWTDININVEIAI